VEAAAHPAVATAAPVPKPATPAPTATQPPATASSADALHLTLTLTEDSVVTLLADGKTVLSDELKAGYQHKFDARDEFRFKVIGNAGGVSLTVNDVPVPPLGTHGKVRHDVVLDREWLQQHAQRP
jgi:Domain of unknown function (DUF4115)